MDKIKFFNSFKEEEEYIIVNIWNDLNLCVETNYPIFSNIFYPIHILEKLSKIVHYFGLKVKYYGLNESSEKKGILFLPLEFNEEDFMLEYTYFKIDAQNRFKTLQHKDFLGTVLSLGLKRESIGDIVVKDNIAYAITTQEIYNIISSSLDRISSIPAKVIIIETDEVPKTEYKEFINNISSLRLDSFVATLANISRSLATTLIEKGEVLVNFNIEKSKNKTVEIGSIITIRKVGKFKVDRLIGETKKDRLKIIFKQYI